MPYAGDGDAFLMERFYKRWCRASDLVKYDVVIKESELFVMTSVDLRGKAFSALSKYRKDIEEYIRLNPEFLDALGPIEVDKEAPEIVKEMVCNSGRVNVGPMASVAGAIAEYVGNNLLKYCSEVIIENGGDIFMASGKERVIAIYAGKSIFSGKLGIRMVPGMMPAGVCTSSGTVGHSLSFGKADAVVVVSKSAIFADAAATYFANLVKSEKDIGGVIEKSKEFEEIMGIVVIKGDKMGVWGKLELVEI